MTRRIVVGHKNGKAVVVGDGVPDRTYVFSQPRGQEVSVLWATRAEAFVGGDRDSEDLSNAMSFLPSAGESRLFQLKIAPLSVRKSLDFDGKIAAEEFAEFMPEMAALREPKDPAMHRTETVDYVVVLEGDLVLELDDNCEVRLKPGDVLVQSGTRHAWRNRGESVATLIIVMLGSRRR